MRTGKLWAAFRPYLWITLASAVFALGFDWCYVPNQITLGGMTGLGQIIHAIVPAIPVGSAVIALNLPLFLLGWRLLGKSFIAYSIVAGGGFSVFYAVFERFPPLWPGLAQHPLVAALAGAAFVGVGVGFAVRAGGAPGGDDALAMSICKLTKWNIQWAYLASDLVVLALSATYIPLSRLGYSLLTVLLSGQLIGLVQNVGKKRTIQKDG